ncbi:MAG: tRNA (5-methylaminomethyl-2-thiouridine)(34)-methyltransferase MnmD [Rubripirellula sp.]|nr:tRNA (5-methylaminomethyl-2-thiouridine)(34)-methyltransferase MnmD [Rubripirellula sp.]
MPPKRPLLEISGIHKAIQITDDNSRTLIDPVSGVAFHSASGALAETRHVYLNNSGVKERLAQGASTAVLEVGLGTGLGMLLTVDEAVSGNAKLEYHALEQDLLPVAVLRELELQSGLKSSAVCESYLDWYENVCFTPTQRTYCWKYSDQVTVTIHHIDAREFQGLKVASFDAVYFDPFAPSVNQELWTDEFLGRMRNLLRDGGQLVTYCVNRRVKDALTACGFEINCIPGPEGGKREVMRATR